MCLRDEKKGKSKLLSGRLCLCDLEAEQRPLELLHIYCSIVNSFCSAPESTKQNPRDSTLDLPFFFCYKLLTSLKVSLRPHQTRVFRTGFRATYAVVFVLIYWLREFLLSAFTNRFELRCEPKQLMLLYYKICPC